MFSVKMDSEEVAKLNRAFKELVKVSDKPIDDLLKQEGRLMAVELAQQTALRGKAPADGKKHEKRIESRIKNIYSDPKIWGKIVSKHAGDKVGRRWERMVKRDNNTAGAEKMLKDLGIGTYRGKRVRVITWDNGRKHRETLRTRKRKNEFTVVCDYKKVNKYIKDQKLRAGNLKSGWARAAEMLGGSRGIPNWAKGKARNHDNKGRGSVTGWFGKKILFLSNDYKKSEQMTDLEMGSGAIKNRAAKIKKRIEFEVKKELKRLKRKYK